MLNDKAPAEANLSQEDAERLHAMARAGIELYNKLYNYLDTNTPGPASRQIIQDSLDEYDERVDSHDD